MCNYINTYKIYETVCVCVGARNGETFSRHRIVRNSHHSISLNQTTLTLLISFGRKLSFIYPHTSSSTTSFNMYFVVDFCFIVCKKLKHNFSPKKKTWDRGWGRNTEREINKQIYKQTFFLLNFGYRWWFFRLCVRRLGVRCLLKEEVFWIRYNRLSFAFDIDI